MPKTYNTANKTDSNNKNKHRKTKEHIQHLSLVPPYNINDLMRSAVDHNSIVIVANSANQFFSRVARNLNHLKPVFTKLIVSMSFGVVIADGCGCNPPNVYVPLPLELCFQDQSYSGYYLRLNNTLIPAFNNIATAIYNCNIKYMGLCDPSLSVGLIQNWFLSNDTTKPIAEFIYKCEWYSQCDVSLVNCVKGLVNDSINYRPPVDPGFFSYIWPLLLTIGVCGCLYSLCLIICYMGAAGCNSCKDAQDDLEKQPILPSKDRDNTSVGTSRYALLPPPAVKPAATTSAPAPATANFDGNNDYRNDPNPL